MIQLVIVGVVLAACLAYVGYRIYVAVRRAGDRCYGCSGCALHDQLMKKRAQERHGGKPGCYNPTKKRDNSL